MVIRTRLQDRRLVGEVYVSGSIVIPLLLYFFLDGCRRLAECLFFFFFLLPILGGPGACHVCFSILYRPLLSYFHSLGAANAMFHYIQSFFHFKNA